MDVWIALLSILGLIHTTRSSYYETDVSCVYVRFYDAELQPFKGLLLQKNEHTDVWLQAYKSDDGNSTSSADQVSSELSLLGNQPVVMVTTTRATYQIPVEWRSDSYMWIFSLLVYTFYDVSYEVEVQLPPQQGKPHCAETSTERFTVLISSKVAGVQWFLNHASTHQYDLEYRDTVFLNHLHCYPEVMIAIQGNKLLYSENGFNTVPKYTYDICALSQLSTSDCSNLVIQDVVLTHSHLLILTQSGLLVSSPSTQNGEVFVQIDGLPFQTQGAHFEADNHFCYHSGIVADKVRIIGRSTEDPGIVQVWESTAPFASWRLWSSTLCSMPSLTCVSIKIVYNSHRKTHIAAVEDTAAKVYLIEEGGGFKFFQLPSRVSLTDILYHPTTTTVYLVGNEIWMSVDGGSTFNHLRSFPLGEYVVNIDHSEQRVVYLTNTGVLYHSRPQSYQILELEQVDVTLQNVSQLVFDSTGQLNAITIDAENGTIQSEAIPLVLNEKENVRVCQFSTKVVNSYLMLVYTSDSDNDTCVLTQGDVGLMTNSSFGNGILLTVESHHAVVSMLSPLEVSGTDFSTQSEWMIYDEQCWFKLVGRHTFNRIHEMDIGDHTRLQVELEPITGVFIPHNLIPDTLWEVSIIFGNPERFDYFITHHHSSRNHTVVVDIWQKDTSGTPVQSTVTFQLVHCSAHCRQCTITAVISSTCPVGKSLIFVYPTQQVTSEFYHLPTNYRPPSWLGTDIPQSPNIYNSDPSQPLMNSKYDISKRTARFNQCAGNSNRLGCNCSSDMATSTDVDFSDCIQLVYKHVYDNTFPLNFQLELSSSGNRQQISRHIIHLNEVNNRTDYAMEGQTDSSNINTNQTKRLIFSGPGLYHFRATLVDSMSFCNLQAQFTVFVVRTPLSRVGEYSTTVLTTVLIGLAILVLYLVHNHIPRLRRH